MNKLLWLIIISLLSIVASLSAEEAPDGWIKHEIVADGFTPFAICLPEDYQIRIGTKGGNSGLIYAIHEIIGSNRQVGGISVSNFEPDYILWNIDQDQCELIPINIFGFTTTVKFYRNNNRYRFETCLIDFMDNKDEKYFHVWCDTNFYLNFIKGNENLDTNNEEIKNVLIKSFSTITETNK